MTGLWLVRHGQTDWNLTGRWQGQSPEAPPLNETGRSQVLALRRELENLHVSTIYSSDLLRARETAELIAELMDLRVVMEPRLREMNLGVWEGLTWDTIKARYPLELAERDRDPFNTCAPRGESPGQVAERVTAAASDIGRRHCGESVLIVAHGISLAVLACLSRGISLHRLYEYIPKNATLFHVEWRRTDAALKFFPWQPYRKLSLSVSE